MTQIHMLTQTQMNDTTTKPVKKDWLTGGGVSFEVVAGMGMNGGCGGGGGGGEGVGDYGEGMMGMRNRQR